MASTTSTSKVAVDEYIEMIRTGRLTGLDRVELIRGEFVEKMTAGSAHVSCVARLVRLIDRKLGDAVLVISQSPIRLLDSMPEPEVAVLRPDPDEYSTRYADPNDVLLVIEVADSTLSTDRQVKAPLYAANGVREYWIVDLHGEAIEVYRQPRADGTWGYGSVHGVGEVVTVEALPMLALAVADLLGRAGTQRGEPLE